MTPQQEEVLQDRFERELEAKCQEMPFVDLVIKTPDARIPERLPAGEAQEEEEDVSGMSSGAPNFPRSPGQHSWRKTGVSLYVIYDHPRDYPEEFVVRRWNLDQPDRGEPMARAATLDDVRALLPPGLYNLGRHEDDDPVIVEVWV